MDARGWSENELKLLLCIGLARENCPPYWDDYITFPDLIIWLFVQLSTSWVR
jgi:hypothetical protein